MQRHFFECCFFCKSGPRWTSFFSFFFFPFFLFSFFSFFGKKIQKKFSEKKNANYELASALEDAKCEGLRLPFPLARQCRMSMRRDAVRECE